MVGRARRATCVLVMLVAGGALVAVRAPTTEAQSYSGTSNICTYDHTFLWSEPGTCRPRAITYPSSVHGAIKRAIYDSAMTFGVPYRLLLSIARCESALNSRARLGDHFGLFQFLPETFAEGSAQMRSMTGIVAYSYWNPRDAAYVAGFLFAVGEATSWTCVYQYHYRANG